jgi:hypothetical protein
MTFGGQPTFDTVIVSKNLEFDILSIEKLGKIPMTTFRLEMIFVTDIYRINKY